MKSFKYSPGAEWAATFFDEGFEETFRLLGKYENTEVDIADLLKLTELPAGAKILDVACGWGRHADVLQKRGFDVTGVDSSPAQIARAKLLSPKGKFYVADMRRAPGTGYSAVLNLWTSFGSLPEVADDISALAHWHSITVVGGLLVMELTTREYAEASNRNGDELRGRKRVTINGVTEDAEFDWVAGVSTNTYSRGGWTRTCVTRLYTRLQLAAMLDRVGYRTVDMFGSFAGGLVRDDRRTVLVARRD